MNIPRAAEGVKMNNLATRSGFLQRKKCDRVGAKAYAVEHVLTYSGALTQVPYNQQLEAGYGAMRAGKIKFDKVSSIPGIMVL
jgi:hypothetical protein